MSIDTPRHSMRESGQGLLVGIREGAARALCRVRKPLRAHAAEIYHLAFTLYCVAFVLSQTSIRHLLEPVSDGIKFVVIGMIFTLLVGVAEPLRFRIAQSLLVLVAITTYITSGSTVVPFLLMFLAVGSTADIRKMATIVFGVIGSGLALVLLGRLVGWIPDVSVVRPSGFVRYSLGFIHPNALGTLVFACYAAFLLRREARPRPRDLIMCAILVAGNLLICNARGAAVATALFPLIYFLAERVKDSERARKIVVRVFIGVLALEAVFSVLMALAYSADYRLLRLLDAAMSGRLFYARYYWNAHPPRLLGQNLAEFTDLAPLNDEVIIDNYIVHILIEAGIVASLLVLLLFVLSALALEDSNRYFGYTALGLTWLVLGMFESHAVQFALNFTLVAAVPMLRSISERSRPRSSSLISRCRNRTVRSSGIAPGHDGGAPS